MQSLLSGLGAVVAALAVAQPAAPEARVHDEQVILTAGDPANAAATLQSDQAGANLGISVASAGDVNGDGFADVIVGARDYDAGQAKEGAAFVFHGGPLGVTGTDPLNADALLQSNQAGALLGRSVAGAGDVNGDGFDDVIVGIRRYSAGEHDEGAALVFHGGAAGVGDGDPSNADAVLQSNQANAELGDSVAGAGDVNGDGFADVIVGADFYDGGETDEGAAFIFYGSAAGITGTDPSNADAVLQSNQANAELGDSVAGAGDMNGDGYGDVIVGARHYDAGHPTEGAAFIFHGGATGIGDGDPSNADAVLQSNQANARLGRSVAGAGDVNGDGFDDVIVGASLHDVGHPAEGVAFVFHGSAFGTGDGDPTTAEAVLQSNQADARFGRSVAGAGDVNGDGFADVIIGAQLYSAGEPGEGAAFVFHGSGAGMIGTDPADAAAFLQSDQPGAELGRSVAGAGDVNGDGFADVIVGAVFYDAGQSDEGAAFVFHGGGALVGAATPIPILGGWGLIFLVTLIGLLGALLRPSFRVVPGWQANTAPRRAREATGRQAPPRRRWGRRSGMMP